MNWLEVSLTVNGELAEAVADVLARFAPNGVMTEQGVKFNDAEDEGTATGPITVRAYLPVDDQLEAQKQKLEEALYFLGRIQPLPPPTFKPIADQNWMEAWKDHYRPIPIGKRLLILPAWMDSPDPARVSIRIDPGMAFGTGTHPTTQLCLELLEEVIETRELNTDKRAGPNGPGSGRADFRVIDVGCGSGILAIAALKLGARTALAVDIDPQSIANARANAATNGIGEELALGVGSVEDVRHGKFPWSRGGLVLVNILAPVIVRMFAAGLDELIEPGGSIILGGILQAQVEEVLTAARAQGLLLVQRRAIDDWAALRMSR